MTAAPMAFDQPRAILAIGGDAVEAFRLPAVDRKATLVVAADSGVDRLVAAGVVPDHLVGDLDSATPDAIARAVAGGAVVHRHVPDKDATDLELALELVVQLVGDAPGDLLVVGPGGGRLDLLVGDVALLAGPLTAGFEVTAHLDRATVTVVRAGRPRTLQGEPTELVSVLPIHGGARGVATTGLRWVLTAADLDAGTSRG